MSIDAVIKAARAEVGYRELGTNNTKFNHWLGRIPGYPHNGYGYPWCHSFVSWCLAHGEEAKAGPRTAGCEVGVAWFRARGRYSRTPKVGDLVYYGPGGGTHVELVAAVTSSTITTIGGNTSGSLDGRYFNGDGVYRKVVARGSSRIHGYGHPNYSTPPKQQEDDMPQYVSVATKAPRDIAASDPNDPDDWHTIAWDAEVSDRGGQHGGEGLSVLTGSANYGLGAWLRFTGVPSGTEVHVRTAEVKPDPDRPDPVVSFTAVDERIAGAGGELNIAYSNPADLVDADQKVRVQVRHDAAVPISLAEATCRVHYWKS